MSATWQLKMSLILSPLFPRKIQHPFIDRNVFEEAVEYAKGPNAQLTKEASRRGTYKLAIKQLMIFKSLRVNNYCKCKWTEFSNRKAEWLNEKG